MSPKLSKRRLLASESKIFGKKVLFEDRNDLTEILSIFLLQKMSFG
jgi:hypothetical protein